MAKERLKVIQAGRLWMAVQYTAIRGADPGQRREAKSLISTPARESLNAKYSWQKLMLLLAMYMVLLGIIPQMTVLLFPILA